MFYPRSKRVHCVVEVIRSPEFLQISKYSSVYRWHDLPRTPDFTERRGKSARKKTFNVHFMSPVGYLADEFGDYLENS